jgi:hypothetical protein
MIRISFFLILLLIAFQNYLYAQGNTEKTFNKSEEEFDGAKCGGTERWAIKVLTDTGAAHVNYTPILTTIDSLVHITTPTPGTSEPRVAGLEYQAYTVNCTITALRTESDYDYHLVISDGTNTMISEVPDPTCSVAATSAHVNEFLAARNWVSTNIGTVTNTSLNIKNVVVTGVTFLDPPHGQSGAAPNYLELHPILNIYFADAGINTPENPKFSVDVFPTSFSESTNFHVLASAIKFGKCSLEIYDLNSNKVQTVNLPVSNNKEISYTFHKGNLATGMYIYRIWNDDTILYEGKLVIQ